MKYIPIFAVLSATLLLLPSISVSQNLVLTNADIYTVNENRDWAEAVAIDEDGIILAVGTKADALQAAGADAEVIDLGGRMVLPGFQDIHLHAVEAGVNSVL